MVQIRPKGSTGTQVNFNTGGVNLGTLLTDESEREFDVFLFERSEYDHQRLLAAMNSDGTQPRFMEDLVGAKIQVGYNCGLSNTPRAVTPNDSVLSSIYRQFNIVRYRITGLVSTMAAVEAFASIANTHRQLWAQFEARQKVAQSGFVSYQELVTLQAETFTYLTATSLVMSGLPLDNGSVITVSGVLIRSFTLTYDFIVPQVASPAGRNDYLQYRGFRIVLESLTEVAQTL